MGIIKALVDLFERLLSPYLSSYSFLGLLLWQYILVGSVFVGSGLLTFFLLTLMSKHFFRTKKTRLLFARVKWYAAFFMSLHTFFEILPFLGVSLSPFISGFIELCHCVFVLLVLFLINNTVDCFFLLVEEKVEKNARTQLGLLQVGKGMIKICVLIVGLLILPSYFIHGYDLQGWLQYFSLGATTLTAVVALASKDIVSNFFGALVITIGRPFAVGDWIIVNKLEGRVTKIDMRSTKLINRAGTVVYVPNQNFVSKQIRNYGNVTYTAIPFYISFFDTAPKVLESFLSSLQQIIEQAPYLVAKKCLVQVEEVGLSRTKILFHLSFHRITEHDRICYLHRFLHEVATLAKREKVTLEK